ncbi:MAG TPA: peptide chain release factor N(5)-glutamine methyltransferase [Thermomicrobiales bacterium]|nr:peptide chain release factor N(5)-glutamine methyltransferase [Thermomicrobiales bacterium]
MTSHADLIAEATERLQSTSTSARLDAEVLLRHVTGLDRTGLFLALRETASADTQERFRSLVDRRSAGAPIAYLTGTREFMGMPFAVTPDVLVPRPETELLVEWALAMLPRFDHRPLRVADVGAGSGAIAVSVAALAEVPVTMTAVEPSAGAREVIARNADSLLPPERRLRFRITDDDLLATTVGPFKLVLANLPYLTPAQIAENPDLAAEPRLALDGGPDGLDLIKRLIKQLPERAAPSCATGLEVDPSQARRVRALLEAALPDAEVSSIRDYAGFERHIVATRLKD